MAASNVQFVSLIVSSLIAIAFAQNCRYSNGLDLSSLQNLDIQCSFEQYYMLFTPCRGNLECNIFDLDQYMVCFHILSLIPSIHHSETSVMNGVYIGDPKHTKW